MMINSRKNPVIEEIKFLSNEYLLKGYLHLPSADCPPLIIGSHGLYSDKNSPKQIELANRCVQNNIAYFRFDHRGCGESKAPFEVLTSLAARCEDLLAAVKILIARDDIGNDTGLFGSSMGGTVCLSVAEEMDALAIVTWAAPIRSEDLLQNQPELTESSDFPFKNNPFDITLKLKSLKNILIFHGDADETVPLSHAREIYRQVQNPKKLTVFQQSDHRMSNPLLQKKFVHESVEWFKSFLNPE